MKLTLSVAGGVTGLQKESTVDLGLLDEETRNSLDAYFKKHPKSNQESTFNECWILNDGQEAPIHKPELPRPLQELYDRMKKDLKYNRK